MLTSQAAERVLFRKTLELVKFDIIDLDPFDKQLKKEGKKTFVVINELIFSNTLGLKSPKLTDINGWTSSQQVSLFICLFIFFIQCSLRLRTLTFFCI